MDCLHPTAQPQESKPATTKAKRSQWETVALWLVIAAMVITSAIATCLFCLKFSFCSQ